jgi:hypothetical protein
MNSYGSILDSGQFARAMVSQGLGIAHVVLTQMAFGGGMLLCYFERLRQSGRSRYAGRFITGYFQDLVMVSFMLGALSGLAMWFTAIWWRSRWIGAVIDEFHWIWATDWTFFSVAVFTGCAYLRYRDRLRGRDRLILLAFYTVTSWFSLFWMSGITPSHLVPSHLSPDHSLWRDFFHPGFWPTLVCRTIEGVAISAVAACAVINVSWPAEREARRDLARHAMRFLAPMMLVPILGAWFWVSFLAPGRSGASGAGMTNISLAAITVVASLLLGASGICAFWFSAVEIGGIATVSLCILVLAGTALGEVLYQSIRGPSPVRTALLDVPLRVDIPVKERR